MSATRLTLPWKKGHWLDETIAMVEMDGWGSDGNPNSPKNRAIEEWRHGKPLTEVNRQELWNFLKSCRPTNLNGETCAAAPGMRPGKCRQVAKPNGETSLGESSTSPKTVRLDTLASLNVEWLWQDRIPLGMMTVIDGNPDVGKSLLTADLAARVSQGRRMPPIDAPDPLATPASVLVLSAEDDPCRTIRPRMEAAGAAMSQIHLLPEINGRPPVLPDDLEAITELIVGHQVRLVIIDPLMAYLGGKVDSHKDQDIRRVLHRIKAMAESTQAAVVLVRHLNKLSGEQEPIFRGGGSIGIMGVARSSLLVGPHPDDVGLRVVARIKGNLSPTPDHLAYRIVQDDNGQPRLEWLTSPVEIDPSTLLRHHGGRRSDALAEAKSFLQEHLAMGERMTGELSKAAQKRHIAERTLQRAASALQVIKTAPRTKGGPWTWRLPQDSPREVSPNGNTTWRHLNDRIPDAAAQVSPRNKRGQRELPNHNPDCSQLHDEV